MELCCCWCCCAELCSVEFDCFDVWLLFDSILVPGTRSIENDRALAILPGECCTVAIFDWVAIDVDGGNIGDVVGDNGFWALIAWVCGGGKNGYGIWNDFPLLLSVGPLLLLLPVLLPPPTPFANVMVCIRFFVALLLLTDVLLLLMSCWKWWKSLLPGRYVDNSVFDKFGAASLRASAVCHSPVAVTFVHCHGLA